MTALADRVKDDRATYHFDEIYLPGEAARYLAASMPGRERPLTSERVLRWIRTGLVSPQHRDTPGRVLTINFEDLDTCQVITLLREAGFSLKQIRRAEGFFAQYFGVQKPFAFGDFWYAFPDILTKVDGQLISGSRNGQLAMEFLEQHAKPVASYLRFFESGRPAEWRPVEGVSLKPTVQLGQPCVEGTRVPTSAVWGYVNAGDPPDFMARSYELELVEVERAIRWEQKLRAKSEVDASTTVAPG